MINIKSMDTTTALMGAKPIPKVSDSDLQNDAKLKEQTDKFEAYFIKKILDLSIKRENELFGKDAGDKIYNSMYNDALSNQMAGGGFGFSELLFNHLKENSRI